MIYVSLITFVSPVHVESVVANGSMSVLGVFNGILHDTYGGLCFASVLSTSLGVQTILPTCQYVGICSSVIPYISSSVFVFALFIASS